MRDSGDPLPSWLAAPGDAGDVAEVGALSAAGAIVLLVRCGAVQAEVTPRPRKLDAAGGPESLALARLRVAESHAAWKRLLPALAALRDRLTPHPPPPAPEAHDPTTQPLAGAVGTGAVPRTGRHGRCCARPTGR